MNIPSTPDQVYGREWRGYGDWLGTGAIAKQDRVYLCFTDAREIVRALNLKGHREWQEWSKSTHRPLNIPSNLNRVYVREWRGWGDWLGTGAIAPMDRVYLCFTDARQIVRALNLKGKKEWCEWSKSTHRPLNIPSHPHRVYEMYWEGWRDWLGKGGRQGAPQGQQQGDEVKMRFKGIN